ncbi:hypothetical protein ACH5RR_039436 [Cinchona calisaya]|uniref:Uncharacterized protein n=1 Tax=Cinchona calisaya TaxID=153742 RepID=A0ABD2Y3U8_9GENT
MDDQRSNKHDTKTQKSMEDGRSKKVSIKGSVRSRLRVTLDEHWVSRQKLSYHNFTEINVDMADVYSCSKYEKYKSSGKRKKGIRYVNYLRRLPMLNGLSLMNRQPALKNALLHSCSPKKFSQGFHDFFGHRRIE